MRPNYWLDLFTHETWNEFLESGAEITGFRENRAKTVQNIKPGDILLCYLTGVSRWIGILEVTGQPFRDTKKIWSVNDFPARVPVRLVAKLDVVNAVPIIDMKGVLSIFQNLKSPHAWTGRFRGSPAKWDSKDGEAIVAAIRDAIHNPIHRPFDVAKLRKMPPILKDKKGTFVTIPEEDEFDVGKEPVEKVAHEPEVKEASAHTEIQWHLLKLGSDMGMEVWVAKNDRGKSYNASDFSSLPRLRSSLPLQFDEATNRTIELIDVLWLKGNSIQAAFEVESTTSIFSGLLRMADLITMQPNLTMPLYIVAPSERRNKVIAEVNRPTFARLDPPLVELCRFISFEELREQVSSAQRFLQFLKPEFLDSFSETCEVGDV
jgi:hypothetical protein